MLIAYLLHWTVIAGWASCHWAINQTQRRACRPISPKSDAPNVAVKVVIPARNESLNLDECVERVLAQRGVQLSITIVNDRSTDDTVQIARRLSERDARCRAIDIEALPAGWMGKSHACWVGSQAGTEEWLLFLDCDVRLGPDAVASAVHCANQRQLDLFSLWPRDASVGFWERLLIPLCGAMIVIWYGHAAHRSNQAGAAFANGQFLLMRRAAYDHVGGHQRVHAALIEDIPLARATAQDGYAVGSALGVELASVRMYRGLREVVRGWRRIYVGVLSPGQMLGCSGSLLIGSLLPYALILNILIRTGRVGAISADWPWLASGAAHLAVLMSVSVPSSASPDAACATFGSTRRR